MSQVERETLERPTSVPRAQAILNVFFKDRVTYSDADFYSRRGACKVLAEEYHPLVRLAQELWGVRSVRLLSGTLLHHQGVGARVLLAIVSGRG